MKEVLRVENLTKEVINGQSKITILNNINLTVGFKEFVAIMGPSGSGKSTLLGIISGLDNASSGDVYINETNICSMGEDKLTDFRNGHIGIVFQSPNLVGVLNAEENVSLPLFFSDYKDVEKRTEDLLNAVGLGDKGKLMPAQLSGGEQQRIAIARALAREPVIIFADEPTGALDSKNGEKVMEVFEQFRKDYCMTIVLVTHDKKVADKADRIIYLKDGTILKEGC